jgi:hypothetical protein
MENATGVRMSSLPMSPPRVRAALDASEGWFFRINFSMW